MGASDTQSPTSLLSNIDGNHSPSNDPSDFTAQSPGESGGNDPSDLCSSDSTSQGIQFVRQILANLEAQGAAQQEASRIAWQHQQQIQDQASNAKLVDRMQRFLASGDPILMAEALAWAEINPGVLDAPIQGTFRNLVNLDETRISEADVG